MAEGHADASIALDADKTCMVQEKGPWTAFYCGERRRLRLRL